MPHCLHNKQQAPFLFDLYLLQYCGGKHKIAVNTVSKVANETLLSQVLQKTL